MVTGSNPVAATSKYKQASVEQRTSLNPRLTRVFAIPQLNNGGDSLMLQRLLEHTTLMMTNRYCQAVGCYDAVDSAHYLSYGMYITDLTVSGKDIKGGSDV